MGRNSRERNLADFQVIFEVFQHQSRLETCGKLGITDI